MVAEASREGVVEYLGYQTDVRPFIEKASAVILPSYHEGLSNVLLEAAASCRPVLTTNVPGCQETFDEGVTGFGFEPGSVESTIQAVEKFLALPHAEREAMGIRGRKKIAAGFSRADVVAAYLKEIKEPE